MAVRRIRFIPGRDAPRTQATYRRRFRVMQLLAGRRGARGRVRARVAAARALAPGSSENARVIRRLATRGLVTDSRRSLLRMGRNGDMVPTRTRIIGRRFRATSGMTPGESAPIGARPPARTETPAGGATLSGT